MIALGIIRDVTATVICYFFFQAEDGIRDLTVTGVQTCALPIFMSAFKLSPSPEAERLVMGLRAIAVLGLATIPLNYAVLKRLLAIVETVRAGDPFVAANASRLQAIAWVLLALNLLSIVIGAIARTVSTPAHPLHLNAGFSISGWLAVLLTFLLARVFAEGSLMREDLEGTV